MKTEKGKRERGNSGRLLMIPNYRAGALSGALGSSALPRSGFTLLEVVIALAIMAIVLVAVFHSQAQSLAMTAEARFQTMAAMLAQGKLAEIEATPSLSLGEEQGDFGDDHPGYRWKTVVAATMDERLRLIEVAVTNERLTRNNTFRIRYYKYRRTS
ncbi:MAG: type II secretion system minor pseudopilin GspI [Deltaproteobacteria bacterium]|nr:type II secretion system minor pseudopilin GspI [Deltaproteobacteria bacterium]